MMPKSHLCYLLVNYQLTDVSKNEAVIKAMEFEAEAKAKPKSAAVSRKPNTVCFSWCTLMGSLHCYNNDPLLNYSYPIPTGDWHSLALLTVMLTIFKNTNKKCRL